MRIYLSLLVLVSSILLLSGCADRSELAPGAYGTILETLPYIKEVKDPFPFPMGVDGNDHQNCEFKDEDN